MCSLRAESVSYSRNESASSTDLQSQVSGGLYSWCITPGLGRLMWGLDHSLFWGNFCSCDYPFVSLLPT